jgi:hypothetical protein
MLGSSSWIPSAPQGVKGTDDADDDDYLSLKADCMNGMLCFSNKFRQWIKPKERAF